MRNGQRKDIRRKQDDFGNPFKTKKDATKARQIALQQEQDKSKPKPAGRKTVAEVFKEYCEKGRSAKAYQTIRKQDSLWENHLRKEYGKRHVDDISVSDTWSVNGNQGANHGSLVPYASRREMYL